MSRSVRSTARVMASSLAPNEITGNRRDRMRVVVVRHHEEDSAGFIGAAFAARGAELSTVLFPKEGGLPEPHGLAHIVLLGSTCSVYDEGEARAWIDEELAWLRRADAAGVPVLGICFGAQMLATAFGGTVEDAGSQEIGWVTVDTADPGLIPPGPWLEFHHDRCLPPGQATVLARNDLGVQAYRLGRHLAVQFHPEVDGDQIRLWLDAGGRAEIEANGQDPDRLLAQTIAEEPGAADRAGQLVAAALRVAAQAREPSGPWPAREPGDTAADRGHRRRHQPSDLRQPPGRVRPRRRRSAFLDRADDRAQQRRELVLLPLGQAGADERLAHVERGEQPLDHAQALGLQADHHQAAVRLVRPAAGQAALLQGLQHAGEGALGDPGLGGQVPRLLLAPDPQPEQHGERGPGQVLVREHLALHVVADHVGGAVDVRHRGHGGEVELLAADALTDVTLGLHEVAGVAGGEATWHSTMVRARFTGSIAAACTADGRTARGTPRHRCG